MGNMADEYGNQGIGFFGTLMNSYIRGGHLSCDLDACHAHRSIDAIDFTLFLTRIN